MGQRVGQRDKHTYNQACRDTQTHTDREPETNLHTGTQANIEKYRLPISQTGRDIQTYRQTGRPADRQADIHTDRTKAGGQTYNQAGTNTHIQKDI